MHAWLDAAAQLAVRLCNHVRGNPMTDGVLVPTYVPEGNDYDMDRELSCSYELPQFLPGQVRILQGHWQHFCYSMPNKFQSRHDTFVLNALDSGDTSHDK